MTQPSAEEINVATHHLRDEAGIWIRESSALADLVPKIDELKYTRMEAGIFQVYVSTHTELVELVAARCKEGSEAFSLTSKTLIKAIDTYTEEDHKFADELKAKGLW